MNRIVVFGAGRIGSKVSALLAADPKYEVWLVDGSEEALDRCRTSARTLVLDCVYRDAVEQFLKPGDIVVAAGPDYLCLVLAEAAVRRGCHYLDFNESASTTNRIFALADDHQGALIPSCGLSPGILSALIAEFTSDLHGPFDLNVYVGALPRKKTNRLGYGQVMNVDGLIREYLDPAHVIADGQWQEIPPLRGEETITIQGATFEAFTTGGISNALPTNVTKSVRNYVYKTLRYPGHLDYMRFLLDDLKLHERRDLIATLLRNGLPPVEADSIIIHLIAHPLNGRAREDHRHRSWRIEGQLDEGSVLYSIAARHAATIVDLIQSGAFAGQRAVRQQDIDATQILSSRHLAGIFD